MATFKRTCDECGESFEAKRAHGEFCSTVCKGEFNNRRAKRGAELYDLMMCLRFGDEDNGKRNNEARSVIQALCSGYREQDQRVRAGRRSYKTFKKTVAGLNRLPGNPDNR